MDHRLPRMDQKVAIEILLMVALNSLALKKSLAFMYLVDQRNAPKSTLGAKFAHGFVTNQKKKFQTWLTHNSRVQSTPPLLLRGTRPSCINLGSWWGYESQF